MVIPAAVICEPGARRVKNDALLEKQVTWSAAVLTSEHRDGGPQFSGPIVES